jgi:hypothetical protein
VAETYCATAAALARLSLVILGNLAIYCKRPEAPERKDSSTRNWKKHKINRTLMFIFCTLRTFPQVDWHTLVKLWIRILARQDDVGQKEKTALRTMPSHFDYISAILLILQQYRLISDWNRRTRDFDGSPI